MANQRAERDKRLDALKDATNKWAEHERKRITHEIEFLKSVLRGRTGAGRLAKGGTNTATALAVNAIKEFLEG